MEAKYRVKSVGTEFIIEKKYLFFGKELWMGLNVDGKLAIFSRNKKYNNFQAAKQKMKFISFYYK